MQIFVFEAFPLIRSKVKELMVSIVFTSASKRLGPILPTIEKLCMVAKIYIAETCNHLQSRQVIASSGQWDKLSLHLYSSNNVMEFVCMVDGENLHRVAFLTS